MIRLAVLMVAIGLGDSLNPTTVAPALYLATTEHPRRNVAEFIIGIFAVNMIGGILITYGAGSLLSSIVPHPGPNFTHIGEIIAGTIILAVVAVIWMRRKQLAKRPLPSPKSGSGSGLALGAGIAALELPTALPYFAAIAGIVGANLSVPEELLLLTIFNVAFLAPLVGILVVLMTMGEHADRVLRPAAGWLQAKWPLVVSVLGLIIGVALLAVGVTGLAG